MGLPLPEVLLAWLATPFATPYCAKGFARGGKVDVAENPPFLIFRSLCMRFLEGDTGAVPLPTVKTGCVLTGCFA